MEKFEAVIEASTLRLRPILMTALATVLGATPLALSSGAGAEARQAIGWVIVGGISLGTLLTLFIIPVAYTLIVRNVHMIPEERDAAEMAGGGVITSPQSKQD
jgi:multidrug efflux pump